MAWFRMIDVRMYGDAKFRLLSSPPPCGQSLWVYLLSGPHTTSLPGLSHVTEGGLADALGWPLKGFQEAFQEVFQQGLARASWKDHVLWVPNAIFYQFPANPNVVKSWKNHLDLIPECELRDDAIRCYERVFINKKGFLEAFRQALREGSRKGMANQEQEQEQEQYSPQTPHGGACANGSSHRKPKRESANDRRWREARERKDSGCHPKNTASGPGAMPPPLD